MPAGLLSLVITSAELPPPRILVRFRRIWVYIPLEPIGEPVDVTLLRGIAGLWALQIVKGEGDLDHLSWTPMSLHDCEHIPIWVNVNAISLKTHRCVNAMSVHVW